MDFCDILEKKKSGANCSTNMNLWGEMMLAYYHYPFIQNQNYREYTQDELMNPEIVEELFDYCQILEAYITKKGWAF